MVAELKEVCSALETLPNIRVYRTRWYAEKVNASLPGIIIDYARPAESLLLEAGSDLPDGDYYYFEIGVKRDQGGDDPMLALEKLEERIEEAEAALKLQFPYKKILFISPEIIEMPFGKQEALSYIADLYIG